MRSILNISFHTEGKRFRLEKVALIKFSFIRLNHALQIDKQRQDLEEKSNWYDN